ncbi:MAG: hypothetical protein KBB32_11375 [Spirochaetia bacterium]|nr:hypothetical protein [Spirochaetia bacterium]
MNARKRCFFALAALVALLRPAAAQDYDRASDPALVPAGDPAYALAEEAALAAGLARPAMEGPATVGQLWSALLAALDLDPGAHGALDSFSALFPDPRGPVDYALKGAAALGWDGIPNPDPYIIIDEFEPGSATPIFSAGDRHYLDPARVSQLLERADLLNVQLLLRAGPLAALMQPLIRPATNVYRADTGVWTNLAILADPGRVDVNMPYRGAASVLVDNFQFRFGRDQVQLGPGRHSSLGLGYNLPYADHAFARASFGTFDVSWYLVRLNPVISQKEEAYLILLREHPEYQLEDNAWYQLQGLERSKHLAATRLTWRAAPWLALAATQYHLVGGRTMQLVDFNPFILFHNLFQEGEYSVPATLDFSAVPLPGLELYGQYMLYDATVADETATTSNAGASAWQLGLTALSTPWFDAGPGRLRLDLELAKTDPWIYGKFISWRQFTSRFILVEPYAGRFWVDYPIGFHLGPDAWELWSRLSYGRLGDWDLALETAYSVRGSVSLEGYGDDADYANKDAFVDSGWVIVEPGQAPERLLSVRLSAQWKPGRGDLPGRPGLSLAASAGFCWLWNPGWVPGGLDLWPTAELAASFSL